MSDESTHRHLIASRVTPTGNPYLDDALAGGLNSENLLLVAAKTGVGKTFFGVQLALFAARQSKNVVYFALEAEKHEIERRQLYYALTKLLYEHLPSLPKPRYREWLHAGYSPDWAALEKEAEKKLLLDTATLTTRYETGIYTPELFKNDVTELIASADKPDLIILDHLHHFFLEGDEISALKTTIHQIKRLKEDLEAPIVVLAQLRKGDSSPKNKRTLPSGEDIRGTAALTDIATDVLIISNIPEDKRQELDNKTQFPMYFFLSKSRTAPEAREYAGIVGFDRKEGAYSNNYLLGKIKSFEDPELLNSFSEKPGWAKRATYPSGLAAINTTIKNFQEKDDE
jgi:hypothetical protein